MESLFCSFLHTIIACIDIKNSRDKKKVKVIILRARITFILPFVFVLFNSVVVYFDLPVDGWFRCLGGKF